MKIELEMETLTSLLGQTSEELTNELFEGDEEKTLKSGASKLIKSKFKDRLKAIEKDAKDEGYGKAKREVLTSVEKDISTKFKVEKGSIEEMFQSVKTKAEENSKAGAVTLDMIKSSEHYDGLFTPFTEKIATLEKSNGVLESDLKVMKKEKSTAKHFSELFKQYDVKKEAHKTSVINKMLLYDLDFKKEVSRLDGEIVKNDMRLPITPIDLFHQTASEWLDKKEPKQKQTPGSNSSYEKPKQNQGGTMKFEGKADFFKQLGGAKTSEQREEIKTAWNEQQNEAAKQ